MCSVVIFCGAQCFRARLPDSQSKEPQGSNRLCCHFEACAFSLSARCASSLSCINEYLSLDSDGNMREYSPFSLSTVIAVC